MLRASRRVLAVGVEQITERLSTYFQSSKIDVQDTSGGCGASYAVYVESPQFEGKPLPAQHKMVVACMKGQTSDNNFPSFRGSKDGLSLPNLFVDADGNEEFHSLTIKTKKPQQ
eukprot:TRINITY_DN10736_c0_g1_i2.p3 TRINITY_DN10736_c0_g1~~TRINITY_DN10736_c0_g1_i2.p3  ORF type:complete len:114 (+),score=53.04 TRINITY_DN10736_c0_g1_i2:67-408(+)